MSRRYCLACVLVLAAACQGERRERAARPLSGGDAQRGALAIYDRGCGACHTVPGVPGARGSVAQSLRGLAQQTYIAGELPNTPDNLVHWIMDPRSVHPATAMPNLGIGSDEARDIAAYLYGLN